ncbi:Methionine synthase [bioreactor metagenome]|uniref:Methionine synthase n=1 Tax=bioreactor metagenome TaxID=1076179 RepID=A0A644ZW72_9ZZZZ
MYLPQIYGLIEGGVDFLLIESVLFIEDCIDIINDINESDKKLKTKTPLIVSATIDENGDLYSGETIEQFNDKISNLPNVISIGLNCSLGAEKIFNHAVKLSNISSIPLTIYPSIGLPDSKGDYAMPAEKFAIHMNNLIQNTNCKIVGGCCGTTPEYINVISNLLIQT